MSTRILFVDDERDLVDSLPPLLEPLGFTVDSTADIAKALELFAAVSYDAVLLDIAMPPSDDMDKSTLAYGRETGVELARRMHQSRPDVPLLALTVIRDEKIRDRMRLAGIRRIISKPAEIHQVADELKRLISRAG